ncbi:MAG: hypothetical protein V1816_24290 [Pseudomonadota bacterium]
MATLRGRRLSFSRKALFLHFPWPVNAVSVAPRFSGIVINTTRSPAGKPLPPRGTTRWLPRITAATK